MALYLGALGRPELLDPDESRHAEIAREMLAAGSFTTPKLGGAPYYDKPVGFHWTVALSLATFGRSAAAARLPSALAALATLAVTAWWARRLRSAEAARFAALGLGTTLLFLAVGRLGSVDMLFNSLLTGAVALLSVRASEQAEQRGSVVPCYVLVGLACLVKGPVAIVLTLPCLLAGGLVLRRRGEAPAFHPLVGLLVVLAIAGPWYVAAASTDPTYMRAFIGLHNLDRFAGTDELGHQSSIAYYALTLPPALLPWTPLVAVGCWKCWWRSRARIGAGEVVLWTWLVTLAVVFGAASTRLVTYLLPAFPALFVCAALGWTQEGTTGADARPARWLEGWTRVWALVVAVAGVTVAVIAATSGADSATTMALAVVTGALATALPLFASRCVARRTFEAVAFALASTSFVAAVVTYGSVAQLLTAGKGFRELARELAPVVPPDGVVSSLARTPHALSFYLDRPVGRVHDLEQARALLGRDVPVFLLVKSHYVAELLDDREHAVEALWRNEQGSTLVMNGAASSAWRRREGVEPSADLYGRQHGFEDRSGHRTRSLSAN